MYLFPFLDAYTIIERTNVLFLISSHYILRLIKSISSIATNWIESYFFLEIGVSWMKSITFALRCNEWLKWNIRFYRITEYFDIRDYMEGVGRMNDTKQVTEWIVQYQAIERSQDTENQKKKQEQKELLTNILTALTPMLFARCSYYFGYTTEDLIQNGYARMIELLHEYDSSRTEVPVLGYLNRMIACYYFSLNRKMRKEQERLQSIEQDTLESALVAEDTHHYEYDWKNILSILNEKEYKIVTEHILKKKTLKTLCFGMHISYPYAKKLKSSALKKLRYQLQSVSCLK